MWRLTRQWIVLGILLLCVALIGACSSQAKRTDDDFIVGTDDPFNDPFFANAPEWDSSVLKQSEVLSQDVPKDPEEPTTWREKSEQALMGAVVVGSGVARMLFLPFLGL